jgi:hypothetical protein
MIICLPLPGGGQVCFWIPVPIPKKPWEPDPDPRFERFLFDNELINPAVERDILTLAGIHAFSRGLSRDLKQRIQPALDASLETLQGKLPKGVTLRFDEGKAKATRKS